jgi:hypothetical protein
MITIIKLQSASSIPLSAAVRASTESAGPIRSCACEQACVGDSRTSDQVIRDTHAEAKVGGFTAD